MPNLIKTLVTKFLSFLNVLLTGGKYGKYIEGPRSRWKRRKKKKKGIPEYFSTETWRRKRAEAFRIHGYKCAICGTTKNLQVHHLLYYRNGESIFGHEDPAKDLRVLCEKHHPKGKYSAWQIKQDQKSFKWMRWFLG